MTAAWKPLATTTLSSSASTVSFGSIPSGYSDLMVVADFQASTGGLFGMRLNNDSSTSYHRRYLIGGGTSATGGGDSSYTYFRVKATGTFRTIIEAQVFDYSKTNKQKMTLFRCNASAETVLTAGNYPQTTAVSSVECILTTGTFNAGATFSLWGSNIL